MLKFNINIILHVFQQMNDMCWLWLFICVSIYIHISCVDLGFFWSQHITFSHFSNRQRDVAIRDPQNNSRLTATKSHACHVKCTFTRHNTSPFLTFPIDSATTRLETCDTKTTRKQSTTPRPLPRKQESFAAHSPCDR